MDLIAVLLHSEASDRPRGITIHLIMVEGIPSSISSPFGSITIFNHRDPFAFKVHSEVSERPKGVIIFIIMVEDIPSSIFSPFGGIQILTV